MKRTLKIVIPIVLILAILIGAYWYFIRTNPKLTAGLCTDVADWMMSKDHPSVAVWFYGRARVLDPLNGELSLKLSNAYRRNGNFTMTERTLVKAIQDAPDNTELYLTLSSVFVQQDKLLDAQKMLDNLVNDSVIADISAIRPAAPTVSPEGNRYNDYITVELTGSGKDTIYYTIDGSFPSLVGDAYNGPFQLEAGETTVCAIAVGENGLVSPATYVGYTVAGVVEDVTLHDAALEAQVRETLHIDTRTLRTDDLWKITELHLPEGLTSTEDLPYFTGLTKLVIWDKGTLDYSFLSGLYALRHLELDHCSLSSEDLAKIAAMPNLEELILTNCGLSNISPLGRLTGLKLLDLTDNSINDINALIPLNALESLYLGHNALTALPVFAGYQSLHTLDLSYNALTDISPLAACPSIQKLNISNNRLTSISAVGSLPALTFLNASVNQVEDVSALAACTNLDTFIMEDCLIKTIDFLNDIASIREVDIDYNEIVAAPQFREDCLLESFSAMHNYLEDLTGLSGLQYLVIVNADYNNVRDISVLADCPVLAQVNVYGTYVHDGGVLTEKGVVVNYTPAF